jgi:hypothetical protein
MLRYQQQLAFFDAAKVGQGVHYVNLSDASLTRGLAAVLMAILREVEQFSPAVVVDSFRAVLRGATSSGSESGQDVQRFLARLAMQLAN